MKLDDFLSRNMSYRDIQRKYNIKDVWEVYHKVRAKYTDEEITEVMNRVYYGWDIEGALELNDK